MNYVFYTLFKHISFYNEFYDFAIKPLIFTMKLIAHYTQTQNRAKTLCFTMNSAPSSKTQVFTLNSHCFCMKHGVLFKNTRFYDELCYFQKKKVFTTNYTPCGWEPFWNLFGTGSGEWRSKAKPSRAEPGQDGPSRAEPSRAGPSQGQPGQWPSRAEPS